MDYFAIMRLVFLKKHQDCIELKHGELWIEKHASMHAKAIVSSFILKTDESGAFEIILRSPFCFFRTTQ